MSCNKCGKCCKKNNYLDDKIIIISPADSKKISNYLRISSKEFLSKYCDLREMNYSIAGLHYLLDLYVLKFKNNSCIFLSENNLCNIYNCRPYQCINAPYNFLAKEKNWNYMPCIDLETLQKSNSDKTDKAFVEDIILGYE